jgi:hypothetical protein
MSRVESGQYIVLRSDAPKVARRTIEAPVEHYRTLAGLLDGTELLLKIDMDSKQAQQALDTVDKHFSDWFNLVYWEDKNKVGRDWGKAGQVTLDYGSRSTDTHTLWKFSWDKTQVTHKAVKVETADIHFRDYKKDEELWEAEIVPQTGGVRSFKYSSIRDMIYKDKLKGMVLGSLKNKSLELNFDDDGNLIKVTFTKNIDLPEKVNGKGGETMRTWSIARDTSRK